MRYWVSWISGNYADEGCTKPSFQFWLSGQMERRDHLPQTWPDGEEKDDCTLCAVIDYDGPVEDIWTTIKDHYPDMEQRFIEERAADWTPGGRFLDYQSETALK